MLLLPLVWNYSLRTTDSEGHLSGFYEYLEFLLNENSDLTSLARDPKVCISNKPYAANTVGTWPKLSTKDVGFQLKT